MAVDGTGIIDAAAESGMNSVSKLQIQHGCKHETLSRMTRGGTAEPVSRDQNIFPVQLTTNRIGNLTLLIHSLILVMTIYILYRVNTMHFLLLLFRVL